MGNRMTRFAAGLLAAVSAVSGTACQKSTSTDIIINESLETSGSWQQAETGETYESFEIPELPEFTGMEAVDSSLYVEPVEGLRDDFIRGVDISSYMAQKESGVIYYDFDGNALSDEEFFEFLTQCGVNWVRIRVWNDPADKNGNSYGGGHNDLDTAIFIGRLASKAGMQVLIDFHYSDFWADPNKQKSPKEWAHYTLENKEVAIGAFTENALNQLLAAGVNLGMVQVGNETNSGMAGETDSERVYTLMRAACSAVRSVSEEYDRDIQIALHYTNPESSGFADICGELMDNDVDFDVFAASYYMFWHGTTERLTENLTKIAETYNKKVMVAETSYLYTSEDGDGFANSVSGDTVGVSLPYEISVQGQANAVRAVIQAVKNVGDDALGVFYWEPAWIPVGPASEYDRNYELWEEFGSGWASSYSASYDPDDAGEYFGGSSWDNQALFDFEGRPLESMNIWKYIFSGTTAPLKITGVKDMEYESPIGELVQMPETAQAELNNGENKALPVTWDETAVAEAETAGAGEYVISGVALDEETGMEYPLTCTLYIMNINYVKNPSFEDSDMTMWVVSGDGVGREQDNNKHSGDYSLKFYSEQQVEWTAEQTIEDLPAGSYELSAFLQGGSAGSGALFQLYIIVNGTEYTVDSGVSSWQVWDNPTIRGIMIPEGAEVTVGVRNSAAPKAWGAWDDFALYKE